MMSRWQKIVGFAGAFLALVACGRSDPDPLGGGIRAAYRIVDATGDVGYYSDMELHPANSLPAISYYDQTNGNLKYAWLQESGDWLIEVVDEVGDVGSYTSLEFSSIGQPHIAYYDATNRRPKYAFFNGAEWVVNTLDYPREGGQFMSLALDINDVARMSFISDGTFNLEYGLYVPVSGRNETQVFTVDTGTFTTGRGGNINSGTNIHLRAAEDGAQNPVIVYYQASLGMLQVVYFDPTHPGRIRRAIDNLPVDWVLKVLDGSEDPSEDVGTWISSTLPNSGDVLYVAYYDSNKEDLKYVRHNLRTDEQVVETVDTTGIVGEGSAITTDRNGIPTIAYYDATNNDLKVAVRSCSGLWQTFRLDLKGIVGAMPSIVAFDDGQIGVAYHDAGNSALKFALFRAYGSGTDQTVAEGQGCN